MSCARCQLPRGKVPTEAAFGDVQRQLAGSVDAGDLTREDGPPVRLAADSQPLATEYYQCRHCEAVWRLTAPRHYPPTPSVPFEHTSPGMLTEMMRAGGASGTPIVREPISMFADSVTLASPDGRFTATITDAREYQAGSPTYGTLTITGGIVREGCSPSMVWSDDSEYLATSQRSDGAHPARVLVFSMRRSDARYAPGEYDGLEFQSFSDGTVRATDGDKAIEIDASALAWDAPEPDASVVEVPVAPVTHDVSGPPEIVPPAVSSARAAREHRLAAVALPRGWTVVDDELRIPASPPSSFDGALPAVAVLGVTVLFWVFVFVANRAGVAQSPVLLGALAVASLMVVAWLALMRAPWRVVFHRGTVSVRATRRRRTAGPVRFAPGLVTVRSVRARAFVTLRISGIDLVLASPSATDAAGLREALVAWMLE